MMGDQCSKGSSNRVHRQQQRHKSRINIGMSPEEALRTHSRVLTDFEKQEILCHSPIWFVGDTARKIHAVDGGANNGGYDDSNARYQAKKHDHVCYRYEILSGLGKGAFGDVYKAYDHATEKVIALKMIRNEKRFHRQAKIEVKVLDVIKEQNVDGSNACVNMLDYFVFRNHLCITFEMHHNDLYTELKAGGFVGFTNDHVQTIAEDTLKCLELLHLNGIVHADLKPENMLLSKPNSRSVTVIDFGSSCYAHQKVHTYIQSRYYRAPEIMLGLGYGTPIDMWSLGCIMVELTTGSPIFPAKNEQELMVLQTEILGVPPAHLLECGTRTDEFFKLCSTGYQPLRYTDRKGRRRVPNGKTLIDACQNQDPLFLDFIRRCLILDPSQRMTPAQAMQHSYITNLRFAHAQTPLKRCCSENGLVAMITRKSSFNATLPTLTSKYSEADKSLNDSGISSHESDTDYSPMDTHHHHQPQISQQQQQQQQYNIITHAPAAKA